MDWERDMVKPGVKKADSGKEPDPFEQLVLKKGIEHARISVHYTEGVDFGAMKVATTVSISCEQTEEEINKAGELAFRKALEITQDGWGVLRGEKV